MRDSKCDKHYLEETIAFYEKTISNNEKEIEELYDIANNVQRFPNDNEYIIMFSKRRNFQLIDSWIRAKYSYGCECAELEEMYLKSIQLIREIGIKHIGYVNFLEFFSLGILFEAPDDVLEVLIQTADEEKLDDILFDFLVSACGLERKMVSHTYQKATPYSYTDEIIRLWEKEPGEATAKAENYMNEKWLRGHFDYGWTKAHKEIGYVGLWSFDTAALMKILRLPDENLKENENYPYDLAHYKNSKQFTVGKNERNQTNRVEEIQKEYAYGIPLNSSLEEIIPVSFHEYVNQLIEDYYEMDGKTFWEKYELNRVWYSYEDYVSKNCEKGWLGHIIVFKLTDQGYILQLDCNEDLQDEIDNLVNYWEGQPVKIMGFVLRNDQQYFAYVPTNISVVSLYEVRLEEYINEAHVDFQFEDSVIEIETQSSQESNIDNSHYQDSTNWVRTKRIAAVCGVLAAIFAWSTFDSIFLDSAREEEHKRQEMMSILEESLSESIAASVSSSEEQTEKEDTIYEKISNKIKQDIPSFYITEDAQVRDGWIRTNGIIRAADFEKDMKLGILFENQLQKVDRVYVNLEEDSKDELKAGNEITAPISIQSDDLPDVKKGSVIAPIENIHKTKNIVMYAYFFDNCQDTLQTGTTVCLDMAGTFMEINLGAIKNSRLFDVDDVEKGRVNYIFAALSDEIYIVDNYEIAIYNMSGEHIGNAMLYEE